MLIGLATSFFNEKNRNIAHDLAELIVESNQEMPEWLEEISKDIARYGVKGNGGRRGGNGGNGNGNRFGGNGGGGSSRFGGRDHRVQYNGSNTSNTNNQRPNHAFGNNVFGNK